MITIITNNIDSQNRTAANARRNSRRSEGTIEQRIRHEAEGRRVARRQIDVMSGLTRSTGPSRGDYKMCREGDKILREYKDHKDPRARKEIEANYRQMQREYRIDNGGGR